MKLSLRYISIVAGCALLCGLTACNGILGGIYDEPNDQVKVAPGTLYVDASSWTDWYYVDLDSLALCKRRAIASGCTTHKPILRAFPSRRPATAAMGRRESIRIGLMFSVRALRTTKSVVLRLLTGSKSRHLGPLPCIAIMYVRTAGRCWRRTTTI